MLQVLTKRTCGEPVTQDMIYFFLSLASVMRLYLNIMLGVTFAFVPQILHSLRRIQVVIDFDSRLKLKELMLRENDFKDFKSVNEYIITGFLGARGDYPHC